MKDTANFLEKETITVGKTKCIISKIPAWNAQKIVVGALEAFKANDFSKLPEDTVLELLSYTAVVNENGGEIVLENQDLINMLVPNVIDLISLETAQFKKNFGFLFDGSLQAVLGGETSTKTN